MLILKSKCRPLLPRLQQSGWYLSSLCGKEAWFDPHSRWYHSVVMGHRTYVCFCDGRITLSPMAISCFMWAPLALAFCAANNTTVKTSDNMLLACGQFGRSVAVMGRTSQAALHGWPEASLTNGMYLGQKHTVVATDNFASHSSQNEKCMRLPTLAHTMAPPIAFRNGLSCHYLARVRKTPTSLPARHNTKLLGSITVTAVRDINKY